MRASLVIIPMFLCAAPAVAQAAAPAAPAEPQDIRIDPQTSDRLVDAIQSLSQALLDLKVGGVLAAAEGHKATPAERNSTVRDLARRDDPNFERHLNQQIAAARPKIEQSIRALNDALPEVTEGLQRAQQSIDRAIANMPDPNYPKR